MVRSTGAYQSTFTPAYNTKYVECTLQTLDYVGHLKVVKKKKSHWWPRQADTIQFLPAYFEETDQVAWVASQELESQWAAQLPDGWSAQWQCCQQWFYQDERPVLPTCSWPRLSQNPLLLFSAETLSPGWDLQMLYIATGKYKMIYSD